MSNEQSESEQYCKKIYGFSNCKQYWDWNVERINRLERALNKLCKACEGDYVESVWGVREERLEAEKLLGESIND